MALNWSDQLNKTLTNSAMSALSSVKSNVENNNMINGRQYAKVTINIENLKADSFTFTAKQNAQIASLLKPTTSMVSSISTKLMNTIKNDLSSKLEQANEGINLGQINVGDQTNEIVNNLSKSISNIVRQAIANTSDTTVTQGNELELTIKNSEIKIVDISLDSVMQILAKNISNSIMQTTVVSDITEQIENKAKNEATQKNIGLFGSGGCFGVIILIAVIGTLAKGKKKMPTKLLNPVGKLKALGKSAAKKGATGGLLGGAVKKKNVFWCIAILVACLLIAGMVIIFAVDADTKRSWGWPFNTGFFGGGVFQSNKLWNGNGSVKPMTCCEYRDLWNGFCEPIDEDETKCKFIEDKAPQPLHTESNVAAVADCKIACFNHKTCDFWTYDSAQKNCILYDKPASFEMEKDDQNVNKQCGTIVRNVQSSTGSTTACDGTKEVCCDVISPQNLNCNNIQVSTSEPTQPKQPKWVSNLSFDTSTDLYLYKTRTCNCSDYSEHSCPTKNGCEIKEKKCIAKE